METRYVHGVGIKVGMTEEEAAEFTQMYFAKYGGYHSASLDYVMIGFEAMAYLGQKINKLKEEVQKLAAIKTSL